MRPPSDRATSKLRFVIVGFSALRPSERCLPTTAAWDDLPANWAIWSNFRPAMTRFEREVALGKPVFSLNLTCNLHCMRCSMTKQIRSAAFAASIAAFLPIGSPTAHAKQCSVAVPSNPQGHWTYRIIDGRKCWYEGKPGLSKSLLEWPVEVSAPPASGEEVASTVPEKARNPLNSQAWAPNSQPWAPSDPDTFEARWRARTVEKAASVTDARPATPEVDGGRPLKKTDRLQSPSFDSIQAKVTPTLVIVPDQPLPVPPGLSRHSGTSLPARSLRASPSARE